MTDGLEHFSERPRRVYHFVATEDGPVTTDDVAGYLGGSRASAHAALRALLDHGLLEREPCDFGTTGHEYRVADGRGAEKEDTQP